MNSYYSTFLNAIRNGGCTRLERHTDIRTGAEAVFADGKPIAGDEIPDAGIIERITAKPHLVLFGCGHVGKALYDLAALQSMDVTVLDPREGLLTQERFPDAERICGRYEDLLTRDFPGFISPYYCIFTHGHTYDSDCLYYALTHPHSYIGMIGSKAKIALCFDNMRAKGITDSMLAEVHSPIGLPINAITPQEIAVSIMAQIISVFRADKDAVIVDASLLARAAVETGIMVRVVEKNGSAPQRVGAMMFVTENRLYGTVGGGAIENHAIDTARNMLRENKAFLVEHHELQGPQPLGMTCGGGTTIQYRLT